MEVTKVCIMLEVDGQTVMVLTSDMDKTLLVRTLALFSPTGMLQVVKLDDSFVWTKLQAQGAVGASQSGATGDVLK